MARSGPLELGVLRALRDAPLLERDRETALLARTYARLIDEATPLARYRDPLRKVRAVLPADDQAAWDAYERIATALAAHSVVSDLGPKLLAALAALGMTPQSRSARDGGTGGPVVDDELAELRARATRRRSPRPH